MPTENEQYILNIANEAFALGNTINQYRNVQKASEDAEKNCITDPVAAAQIKTNAPKQIKVLEKLLEKWIKKYPNLAPGLRDTINRFYKAFASAKPYVERVPEARRQVKKAADDLYKAIA